MRLLNTKDELQKDINRYIELYSNTDSKKIRIDYLKNIDINKTNSRKIRHDLKDYHDYIIRYLICSECGEPHDYLAEVELYDDNDVYLCKNCIIKMLDLFKEGCLCNE